MKKVALALSILLTTISLGSLGAFGVSINNACDQELTVEIQHQYFRNLPVMTQSAPIPAKSFNNIVGNYIGTYIYGITVKSRGKSNFYDLYKDKGKAMLYGTIGIRDEGKGPEVIAVTIDN